jgi:alpha-1,2-mannosyltransferase
MGNARRGGSEMATRAGKSQSGPALSTASPSRSSLVKWRPVALWAVAFTSASIIAYLLALVAHFPQMDFQVYRMGAQHVLAGGLYSAEITVLGRHLLFTYPPLAAILFWPLSHFSIFAGQTIWDVIDLVALTALIAVSIAAARTRSMVRSDWRTALILLAPIGFLLFPVRYNLALGQINVVLVLMIVADLTIGVSWRGRDLPKGVLVGAAAAIKLTPLIFLPYLVASRQWRPARNAALTFALATGAMFAVSPRASWLYFTKDAFDTTRVGSIDRVDNQTLHGAIARAHLSMPPALFALISLIVLCVGIGVAAVAYRRSSSMLGILVCAATGLMLSPISWLHHYVWIVPGLIWLVSGTDRPARGERWAMAGALAFIVIPPMRGAGSGVLWYVQTNVYVMTTLAFIGLAGAMLYIRSRTLANTEDHWHGAEAQARRP